VRRAAQKPRSHLNIFKPEPPRRASARRDREEGAVAAAVREAVEARDGHCRLAGQPYTAHAVTGAVTYAFGECGGPAEWAHLEGHRRFETRGMAPEERHTTGGSVMFCRAHHHGYDAHRFAAEPQSDRGADGRLAFDDERTRYVEP
jgi:hypothetical protein